MIGRRGDWLTATVSGEMVMMSVREGKYIGLSEVGVRIWELIETPQTLDALCLQLGREFDIDAATCRREVEAFLDELAKHGAATLDLPG